MTICQSSESPIENTAGTIGKSRAHGWRLFLLKFGLALMCCVPYLLSTASAETFCIDYQYFPNTNNLRVYDFTILSPYCAVDLQVAHAAGKKAYAYISAGEIAANAQYYQAAVAAGVPFIAENPNWASMVVDLSSPKWAPFVVNQLALPAVNKGYDGFFLDTMDSYYLADPSVEAAQEAGLVSMVKALKAAYPSKKIIINRGFPMFSRLANTVDGMLVEGLYYTYPGVPQDAGGTSWLLGQIAPVKAAGKAVYIVDYVDPTKAGSPTQIAQQITQQGLTPLVSPPALDGTVLAPVAAPRIEKFAVKNGVPTITFTALKAKAYRVERTASIRNGPWLNIKDVAGPAVTTVMEVTDTTAAGLPLQFYRLVTN
jgi:uncharacterized protein (TIGR01370 family)